VPTAYVERLDLAMQAIPGEQSLSILAPPALAAMHEPEINAAIPVGRLRDRPSLCLGSRAHRRYVGPVTICREAS